MHRQNQNAEPDGKDEVRLWWHNQISVVAFEVFLVPPAVLSLRVECCCRIGVDAVVNSELPATISASIGVLKVEQGLE